MLVHPSARTTFVAAAPDLLDDFSPEINHCCDPLHEDGGKWYFWEETWADRQGPFETREIALESLRIYCDWLDGALPEQLDKHGDDGV